jgi:putative endonuclease
MTSGRSEFLKIKIIKMIGYVYIIQSVESKRFYIGSSIDFNNRLKQHNNGEVKTTKNKGPCILKFYKKYNTIKEARQIEYRLKKFKSRDILENIIKNQEIKIKIKI